MTSPWRLRGRFGRQAVDARRTVRIDAVLRLAERFVHDLGQLLGGGVADLEPYVDNALAARLRHTLQTATDLAGAMHPDFSDYAEVRIAGDVLDLAKPVRAAVEFDDRSTWSPGSQHVTVRARRRVRIDLVFDAAITTIVDQRIELV